MKPQRYERHHSLLGIVPLRVSCLSKIVLYILGRLIPPARSIVSYVYVPFGELIMSYLSVKLSQEQHMINTTSAEGAGLSPDMPISKRVGIKGDRLVNQMFACEWQPVGPGSVARNPLKPEA
jgi:hypothetical protein